MLNFNMLKRNSTSWKEKKKKENHILQMYKDLKSKLDDQSVSVELTTRIQVWQTDTWF